MQTYVEVRSALCCCNWRRRRQRRCGGVIDAVTQSLTDSSKEASAVHTRGVRTSITALQLQSYAQFTPPTRHDKTVLSVSCRAVVLKLSLTILAYKPYIQQWFYSLQSVYLVITLQGPVIAAFRLYIHTETFFSHTFLISFMFCHFSM